MDAVAHRFRGDAVLLVVGLLEGAAAVRLADGAHHAVRHHVGVHDDLAVHVSGGAADGLHQRRLRAQEALLVRVEDGDQAHLRQVEALAQEVDAHQDVVFAQAQAADELHALHGRHVGVEVAHAHLHPAQVLGEGLGHALGQRRDQHALLFRDDLVDLAHQVVHLAGGGAHVDLGVEQARRADDLLHDLPRLAQLVGPRGRADVDRLADAGLEFLKQQRAVVIRRGQAEAVLHQLILAGPVAVVHRANLRHGDVALVDEAQEPLGEVVQEGVGRVAGLAAVEIAGIILDAGAVADLPHHLDVVIGALGDALGLQVLALRREALHRVLQILLDDGDVLLQVALVRRVVGRGEHRAVGQAGQHMPADHVDLADPVDLVAEELDAQTMLVHAGGDDLDHVAPHPEGAARKLDVVALVLDVDQLAQEVVPLQHHAGTQGDHLAFVLAGVTHRINARHGRDDDHVPALAQCGGGAVAEAVDLLVDRGVLLNVCVRGRDVGLGLVIIVVADEVLHAAVGEEGLQFRAELGREGLVVGDNEGGPLDLLDDGGHRKRLAGAGHAEEHLGVHALLNAGREGLDGLGLVAGGLVGGFQDEFAGEFGHGVASFRGIGVLIIAQVRADVKGNGHQKACPPS